MNEKNHCSTLKSPRDCKFVHFFWRIEMSWLHIWTYSWLLLNLSWDFHEIYFKLNGLFRQTNDFFSHSIRSGLRKQYTKQQHKNIYDCCIFVIEELLLLSENINYWHCIWDNKLKLNSFQKSIFPFELHEVADTLLAAPATVELMQFTIWKHFTAFDRLFSFGS